MIRYFGNNNVIKSRSNTDTRNYGTGVMSVLILGLEEKDSEITSKLFMNTAQFIGKTVFAKTSNYKLRIKTLLHLERCHLTLLHSFSLTLPTFSGTLWCHDPAPNRGLLTRVKLILCTAAILSYHKRFVTV